MKKSKLVSVLAIMIMSVSLIGCANIGSKSQTADPNSTSDQQTDTSQQQTGQVDDKEEKEKPPVISAQSIGTETDVEPGMENVDTTYDYLAIGNSVTIHENDGTLWWGTYGMAATAPQYDYVHLVAEHLKMYNPNVNFTAYNFQPWEENKNADRSSYLTYLDQVLNDRLDLITVQIGENITAVDATTAADYDQLIEYINAKAPNAKVIFLGDILWEHEDVQGVKAQETTKYGVPFLNYDDIRLTKNYVAGLGTQVLGDDGALHTIDNEVVAAHPNNTGMQLIADRINQTVDILMQQ